MKTVLFSAFITFGLGLLACNNNSSGDNHQDTVDSAKAVNKEVKAVQPDAYNFAIAAANGGSMEVVMCKMS